MTRTSIPAATRLVFSVSGLAFLGIGLTVLISLWIAPFGSFGSPPIFFRIFGSFIAVIFIAVGGTVAWTALTAQAIVTPEVPLTSPSRVRSGIKNYTCPKCGAPLDKAADISPHGDAKCSHCSSWFNIHSG